MAIVPDTKDWTWVLRRPCPECGFDTQSFALQLVPGMLVTNAAAWREVLTGPGDLRRRPAPGKWSAVEYGCHVRDVFRLYDQRLELMLSQDDPLFPNWDQDATAVADRYAAQDPAEVAAELGQYRRFWSQIRCILSRSGTASATVAMARIFRNEGRIFVRALSASCASSRACASLKATPAPQRCLHG